MEEKSNLEEKKVLVELAKVIEGQIRGLILMIVALGGGLATLTVNYFEYKNQQFVVLLLSIGSFLEALLAFIALKLWTELEELKKRINR